MSCDRLSADPACITGHGACTGPLLITGKIIVYIYPILALFALWCAVKNARVIARARAKSATGTALILNGSTLVALLFWTFPLIISSATKRQDQLLLTFFWIGVGSTPMFGVCTYVSFGYIWKRTVNAARSMSLQHVDGTNKMLKRIFLATGALVTTLHLLAIYYLTFSHAAIIDLSFTMLVMCYFLHCHHEMKKLMSDLSSDMQHAKGLRALEAVGHKIRVRLAAFFISTVAYGGNGILLPRTVAYKSENVFLGGMLFSICACSKVVLDYCDEMVKGNAKKVRPVEDETDSRHFPDGGKHHETVASSLITA